MGNRNTLERTRVWEALGCGRYRLTFPFGLVFLNTLWTERKPGSAHPSRGRPPTGQRTSACTDFQAPSKPCEPEQCLVSSDLTISGATLPEPHYCQYTSCGICHGPLSLLLTQQADGVSKDRSGPAAHLLNPPSSRRRKALCVWSVLPLLPLDITSHSPHPSSHSASLPFLQHTRVGPASGPLLEQYLPQDAPHPRSAGPAPCLL